MSFKNLNVDYLGNLFKHLAPTFHEAFILETTPFKVLTLHIMTQLWILTLGLLMKKCFLSMHHPSSIDVLVGVDWGVGGGGC